MMRPQAVVSIIAATVLCACGGGMQSLPAPPPASTPQYYTPLPPDTPVQFSAMPAPFDPQTSLRALGTAQLVNALPSLKLPRRTVTSGFALAPAADHQASGVYMFGNAPPYNALFATQTAYEAGQRPLPFPAGASGMAHIYAPTTHPAWGACFENSSLYISSRNGETAMFTVFNFCLPSASFVFAAPIDRAFLHDYVRLIDGEVPSYVSEIFTPDAVPSGASTWYSLLYNFTQHHYDVIAKAKAGRFFDASAYGWSVVELYPPAGTCPQIAPALASHLAAHNTRTGAWDAIAPSMDGAAVSFVGFQRDSKNSCLRGDAIGSASIDFNVIAKNWRWEATSPQSAP